MHLKMPDSIYTERLLAVPSVPLCTEKPPCINCIWIIHLLYGITILSELGTGEYVQRYAEIRPEGKQCSK